MRKILFVLSFILAVCSVAAAYDVPSFWEVNDGNLRYVGIDNTQEGETVHFYECDINKYNDYFDKYMRKLAGYPFHEIRRFNSNSEEVFGEERAYIYDAPTYAKKFVTHNTFGEKLEFYHAHLEFATLQNNDEGVIRFAVGVANGLTYNPQNTEKSYHNFRNENPGNYDNHDHHNDYCLFCSGTGRCHICSGIGYSNCYGPACVNGRCMECRGTGVYNHGTYVSRCIVCGGDGLCNICNGKGRVDCGTCYGNGRCNYCNGTGKKLY